jgi:NADH-quinone oxidoreductase subunit L
MLVPLLLLALGAVAAGGVFAPAFIGEGRADFWRGAIFNLGAPMLLEASSLPPGWSGRRWR